MTTVTASTKIKNEDGTEESRTASVEFDFGSNLDEAVKMFGPDRVYRLFIAKATVAVQSRITAGLQSGKTPAEIQSDVDDYNLEGRKVAKSKAEKAADIYDQMTPEQRAAFMAMLKQKSKEAKAA